MIPTRQRGAALLALLAIIVLGGTWWLLSGMSRVVNNRTALERKQSGEALRLAKQALIGYAAEDAATNDLNPGSLPCPEAAGYVGTTNEGIAAATCSLPAVGRLPWRTLGIEKLQDAAGEPLWYVVSPGWALPSGAIRTLGINSNSRGNLAVNGVANVAVAVIIAPGPPMNLVPDGNQTAVGCATRAQVRNALSPNYLDYLECQNVAGASLRAAVPDNTANPVFNDQVTVVTAGDVLAAVEPIVAMRIQRDVVPQLQSIYATSDWGAGVSAANPLFPFAATYANPSTSAFKGVAGTTQGFLPLTSSVCNTATNGPCDSTFVAWNLASVSVSQTGGTASTFSSDCSASTTSQIVCTVNFSRLLCLLCGVNATIALQGSASNVGNALRSVTTASCVPGASTTCTGTALTTPLQADASAAASYTATLNGGAGGLCGSILSIACSGSATITIPIFPDHAFLSATGPRNGLDPPQCPATPSCTTTSAWFWFLANNWHQVTYYAIAPLHAPGGAGNCSGATCISVTVHGTASSLSNKRAVVALAGRSLLGTTGSNRPLGDFLDSSENTNLDLVFEQYSSNKFFNDRFVSINP